MRTPLLLPRRASCRARGRQRGSVMFVALAFLLVMALMAGWAVNTAGMGERVARNQADRDLAFQVAEAALRDAEDYVFSSLGPASPFSATCDAGLCLPSTTATSAWDAVDWSGTTSIVYGVNTGRTVIPGIARQPRYIIELLPEIPAPAGSSLATGTRPFAVGSTSAFRITARAWGADPNSQVMVQSVFVKQ